MSMKMVTKFVSSTKGNFSLVAALVAIPLLLAVGLSVDFANMSDTRAKLQAALDAASMQIAVSASSGLSDAGLEAFGNRAMLANLDPPIANSTMPPALHYYGISTQLDGSQILSTAADFDYRLQIIGAFLPGEKTRQISVRAKIRSRAGDPACVYALNRTAARAINVSGSTKIAMDGCIIASNSSDDESIYVGGSGNIQADCAQAAGRITATNGMSLKCPSPRENAWVLEDPFKNIPAPAPPMSLIPNPKKNDSVVNPGRYSNLSLDGTKTLLPGVYYVEGTLDIKGTISGSGVMFFMKNGGISVNGNASLMLNAATAGPFAGMLFMAARDNTFPMKFNGNGATELNGFIYSAKGPVDYSGNNSTVSTCLRIVADTITLTGSTTMKSDCSATLGGRVALTSGPLYFAM